MAFRPLNTSNVLSLPKELKPIVGTFAGSKPSNKANDDGKAQMIHQFTDEDGGAFGIWGFANLDRELLGAKVGQKLRMTYKGKTPVTNKKTKLTNQVNQVLVEVDEYVAGEA